MLDLSGTWSLADERGEYSLPAAVPGDVHSALHAAGLIPDPYHGRNEYGLRWVADRDWTLSRSFEDTGGPRLLVVDGLDTVAEVRLNGAVVLQAASRLPRARGRGRDGRRREPHRDRAALQHPPRQRRCRRRSRSAVPYHAGNCPIPNGNMLRKPQCDFGWDWNIALAPLGLYGRIALVGPEGEIAGALIRQHHADGAVVVEIDVVAAQRRRVRDRLARSRSAGWTPAAGSRLVRRRGTDPDETDHRCAGALVAARLRAAADPRPRRHRRRPDPPLAAGAARHPPRLRARRHRPQLRLRVNGRDIFARGANWIPADALPGRITDDEDPRAAAIRRATPT